MIGLVRLLLLCALLAPAGALAEDPSDKEEGGEAEPEAEGEPEGGSTPTTEADLDREELQVLDDGSGPSAVDLLTQRMIDTVQSYYEGVGQEPTTSELDNGVESIRLLLLDGVSLSRILAAAEEAVRLHTPGRRVPFEVAVPLRIKPRVPREDPLLTAPGLSTQAPLVESAQGDLPPEVTPLSAEDEARLLAERRTRSARRARIRLYRQWQERTKNRRNFLAVGIVSLTAGYAIGFAHAGALALAGEVPHYSAWVTAIPVVGNITFTVWFSVRYPLALVCALSEWAGVALIIAGLAHKIDWPYERDPTAMRSPRRPKVTLAFVPTGGGGMLVGRF
jgi:hypothetical protein